jgi:NitT/TauT family transport system substrate-binding protein
VGAASVMEPWISVAQKQRFRVLIEAHSSRREAASDDLDGPTLAAMFRAEARAVEKFNQAPQPYSRERFKDT